MSSSLTRATAQTSCNRSACLRWLAAQTGPGRALSIRSGEESDPAAEVGRVASICKTVPCTIGRIAYEFPD